MSSSSPSKESSVDGAVEPLSLSALSATASPYLKLAGLSNGSGTESNVFETEIVYNT